MKKALLNAILENDFEAVKASISQGGNVNTRYYGTKVTPIHVAAYMGHDEILKYLLIHGATADCRDKYGRTPLYFAALSGEAKCIKRLIEQNVDVNKRTRLETSASNRSSQMSFRSSNSFVLANDIPSNYKDLVSGPKIEGKTPLHEAVERGHWECVWLLLKHEADPNVEDEYRVTPLLTVHNVAAQGDEEKLKVYENIIEMLLAAEASVNAQNLMAETALHHAVRLSSLEAVRCLLEKGADVTLKSDDGMTALHHAVVARSLSVIELVLNWIKQIDEDFKKFDIRSKLPFTNAEPFGPGYQLSPAKYSAECLLGPNAAAVIMARFGENVLNDSSQLQSIVQPHRSEYKLENVVNCQDDRGRTPLHLTALNGSVECAKLLISYEASLIPKTKSNESFIEYIFSYTPNPHRFFQDVLDSVIHIDGDDENNMLIEVKLSTLIPKSSENQMTLFQAVVDSAEEYQVQEILQHPVIELFLLLKWRRIKPFFYFVVSVYICFILSLSSFVILNRWEPGNMSQNSSMRNAGNENGTRYDLFIIRIVLYVSSAVNIFYVLVQILVVPKYFVKQWETWRIIICSVLSLVIAQYDGEDPNVILQHITSYVVIFSWIQVMYSFGRFPSMGYYALMFSTVLKSVVKALLTFICLIIGFAISFYVQYSDGNSVQSLWYWLVKTMIMITGEYGHDEIFDVNYLIGTSRIILLLFVILGSIVLVNLMVGLAVADIKEIRLAGNIQSRLKRADFMYHFEKCVAHPVVKKLSPRILHSYVKKQTQIPLSSEIIINPIKSKVADLRSSSFKIPRTLNENLKKIVKRNLTNHSKKTF